MDYTVLRNVRVDANAFKMEHSCDFCENYVSQVVLVDSIEAFQICKGCLDKLSIALDNTMQDNFESDFKEERK